MAGKIVKFDTDARNAANSPTTVLPAPVGAATNTPLPSSTQCKDRT